MIITSAIKERMGNWWQLFLPFIESSQWDDIFTTLQTQAKANRTIIPKSADTFNSFKLVDRHKLKCLILLMDPYPTFTKEGIMIASGVPMCCKNTGMLQPSLEHFYTGIEDSYIGFDPDFDRRPDNSYLLKEEAVMLLNTSLTVEKDKVGSHSSIWLPFMKFFIEEIINKYFSGLPVVLCGQSAQKLEKYFNPLVHHIKKIEHPVAASYQNRQWNYEDIFKWCNAIIRSNNGPGKEIRWYRKKGEDINKEQEEYSDWLQPIEPFIEKEKKVKKELPQSFNSGESLKSAKELQMPWDD